jgi:serine/threonine-protein kinase
LDTDLNKTPTTDILSCNEPDKEPELGKVDRYVIIKKLGTGGFGAVFKAKDTIADIYVALKALPPEISNCEPELENVRANFALVSKLHHHNIASLLYLHKVEQIHDPALNALGINSGTFMVVMEYVDGTTLDLWQKKFPGNRIPTGEVLHIARQTAEALDFAHFHNILHRDIKPSNIMITRDMTVKVLDFGLAYEIRSSLSRVSRELSGSSAGTPCYMSPEQWSGRKLTPACDQYALACMFYQFVSGKVPFSSAFDSNDFRLMKSVVKHDECEPLKELSPFQNAVIKKAMSKVPEERFPSCSEFVAALEETPMTVKPPRNLKILLSTTAAILLIIFCSILFLGPCRKQNKTVKQTTTSTAPPDVPRPISVPPPKSSPETCITSNLKIKMLKLVNEGNGDIHWISQKPITASNYLQFLKDTGKYKLVNFEASDCPLGLKSNKPYLRKAPDSPMTGISPQSAFVFCQWLTRQEKATGKVPDGHAFLLPHADQLNLMPKATRGSIKHLNMPILAVTIAKERPRNRRRPPLNFVLFDLKNDVIKTENIALDDFINGCGFRIILGPRPELNRPRPPRPRF